jgi:OmpA-OmpF porin, OOP family
VTARSLSRLGFALVIVSLVAAVASATPKTLEKVDPKAPCFRWPAVDLDHDGVFDRLDRCDNTPLGAVVDEWGCPIDSDRDGVFDGLDKCPDTPPGEHVDRNGCSRVQLSGSSRSPEMNRTTSPPQAPAPKPAPPVSETERQLVEGGRVRLENVYFETNSANLLPESETTLNEVGAVLEKFVELRVEVQGHTDTRGSSAYNMKLSQARAESVRSFLVTHFHLRDGNVIAKGYGETQPETREKNDEERLRNRRVVIKALNPEVLPKNVKVEQH